MELPRPLTHDLLADIISKLGAVVKKVVIHKLFQGTFFARIVLLLGGGAEEDIDSRPSDAIALALRTEAPIFAEEHLLDSYSLQ